MPKLIKLTDAECQAIRKRYEQKVPLENMYEEFGYSRPVLAKAIRRAGGEIRVRGRVWGRSDKIAASNATRKVKDHQRKRGKNKRDGAGRRAWITRLANRALAKLKASRALDNPDKFIKAFYHSPDSVSPKLTQDQIRWVSKHAEEGLLGYCVASGFKYSSLEEIENSEDRLCLAEESLSQKDMLREFSFRTFERVFPHTQDSYEALINIMGKSDIDQYLSRTCKFYRYRWLQGDTFGVLAELVDHGLYDIDDAGKEGTPPDVVQEVLNALPDTAWYTGRIFDPAVGFGTFLLTAQNKLNEFNHLTEQQVLDRLCGFDVCRRRAYITAALLDPERIHRPRIYVADTLKELQSRKDLMSRFGDSLGETVDTDELIIVGNFPFQDKKGNENSTTSKNLASRFMLMAVELEPEHLAVILPAEWSGPKKNNLKKILFNEAGMKKFIALGRTRFPGIQKNICYVICQLGYEGKTLVRDSKNKELELDLTKTKFIPSNNLDLLTIFNRIKEAGEFKSVGHRHARGELNGPRAKNKQAVEIDKNAPNAVEFIVVTGGNKPMTTIYIDKSTESAGRGKHKVVMCQLGSHSPGSKEPDGFGVLKVAKASQVCGHAVVFMTAESKVKAENLKTYLETKFVRFLVRESRMTPSNSKNIFEYVPDVDLSVEWTDKTLYEHFKLTEYEIRAIESTTNNLKEIQI